MFLYNEKVEIRELLRIIYEYPLIKCYTQFSTALPGSAPKSSDWDIAFFWRFINGSAVLQSMYTHVDVKIKFFILYVATIIRLLVSQLNLLTAILSTINPFPSTTCYSLELFFLPRIVKKAKVLKYDLKCVLINLWKF